MTDVLALVKGQNSCRKWEEGSLGKGT